MLKFAQNQHKFLNIFKRNNPLKAKLPTLKPQYHFSYLNTQAQNQPNATQQQQQLNPLYNINIQKSTQQIFHLQDPEQNKTNNPVPPQNNDQNNQNNDNLPPENNDNNDNNNNEEIGQPLQPLQAVPLRSYKKVLTEEEKQLKQEKHILFSSQQPILPYTSVPCQLRTGNLQEIAHPLSYFLLNENGEIYLVGIELENKVQSELNKTFQENKDGPQEVEPEPVKKPETQYQQNSSLNMEITPKKMSSRVQIIEIQVNDQGIFAVTIPYKDNVPTPQQEQFNLEAEIELIKNSVKNIKKSVSYEKIEIFQDLDIDRLNFREFSVEQLDQVIFQILSGIQKLYARYMKETINLLIQNLLESRSIITRVQLIRHHLESLEDVLEIVNKNFKAADENMIRMHTQARARMSMEYIKQTYFANQKESSFTNPNAGPASQGQQPFGPGAPQQQQSPIQKYQDQLSQIEDLPSREKVAKEIQRFSLLDKHSSEYHKVNTYLDEVFSIPWKKYSEPFWDIDFAQKKLDEQIYGLEKVKQRIIEMIAVNQLKNSNSKDSKGFIVLLYGPPGIGKTSIAKAVASSLQKEYRFITFAGVSDPYFIKGHRRTYVDSQPGVFIKELIKADTMNPVFILDEIDKVSRSSMGADPYYTLLEILNPDENSNFVDHYMDIKVDFSNVIFILTANEILHMLEPLRNRLELIEIPAYIEEEKLQIGKNFLMPKVFEQTGMNPSLINFNDTTLSQIINNWCYHESGVRQFSRAMENISRKFAVELLQKYPNLIESAKKEEEIIDIPESESIDEAMEKVQSKSKSSTPEEETSNEHEKVVVEDQARNNIESTTTTSNTNNKENNIKQDKEKETQQKEELSLHQILTDERIQKLDIQPLDLTKENSFELLKKYLGTPPHDTELEKRSLRTFPPGTLNVLTVSGFVGHALTVECAYDYTQIDKKGAFSSSGNLKTVLKESLQIAKINAYKYLNKEQIEMLSDKNFHIHFMQGSTPKDGPSAGTAITTALLSLILDKKIPSSLGMTGEISLNGEVCKIGGLQSKIIGCKTVQISTILAPYANMNEALEFPQQLLDGITIHFVKDYNQIYELLFEDKEAISIPGIITMKDGKIVSPMLQQTQNISPDMSSISQSM